MCHRGLSLLCILVIVASVSIAPDHTKPCIPGDAWGEECLACTCGEDRTALCRPTPCRANLSQRLDTCREGATFTDECKSCKCEGGVVVCERKVCLETNE